MTILKELTIYFEGLERRLAKLEAINTFAKAREAAMVKPEPKPEPKPDRSEEKPFDWPEYVRVNQPDMLPAPARSMYLIFAYMANRNGYFNMSVRDICDRTGFGDSTVRRNILLLTAANLLTEDREDIRGKGNGYQLRILSKAHKRDGEREHGNEIDY